ncbi:MAG: hypothetical protein OEX00_02900 [Gammaproteobacteria bacterium]|nr:hypothetical protein [Gammaproteobacteria bacterium]MDH5692475.1 hypothetical protein [Gammaproteobacteria bacterium]
MIDPNTNEKFIQTMVGINPGSGLRQLYEENFVKHGSSFGIKSRSQDAAGFWIGSYTAYIFSGWAQGDVEQPKGLDGITPANVRIIAPLSTGGNQGPFTQNFDFAVHYDAINAINPETSELLIESLSAYNKDSTPEYFTGAKGMGKQKFSYRSSRSYSGGDEDGVVGATIDVEQRIYLGGINDADVSYAHIKKLTGTHLNQAGTINLGGIDGSLSWGTGSATNLESLTSVFTAQRLDDAPYQLDPFGSPIPTTDSDGNVFALDGNGNPLPIYAVTGDPFFDFYGGKVPIYELDAFGDPVRTGGVLNPPIGFETTGGFQSANYLMARAPRTMTYQSVSYDDGTGNVQTTKRYAISDAASGKASNPSTHEMDTNEGRTWAWAPIFGGTLPSIWLGSETGLPHLPSRASERQEIWTFWWLTYYSSLNPPSFN